MDNQAFFTRDGDGFSATPASRGPWRGSSLHGRVVIGLLGHAVEARCGDGAYMPTRLTVDMYRLPDFSPITVETRLVRDGYRIKVIDAEMFSGGTSVARATSQLLRRTENPPGQVWSRPNWDAPKPEGLVAVESQATKAGLWTMRPIVGEMGSPGARRTWMSEVRDLIQGTPLTPFVRAALAADFASPFANGGDQGLGYINTDVTLYLHREPRDEWIGFEVANHQASDGVAIGECWVYDVEGAIGSASVCALGQRRAMRLG
jgi:hypothetical protein